DLRQGWVRIVHRPSDWVVIRIGCALTLARRRGLPRQGGTGMRHLMQNHSFQTTACGEFLDVTDDVREIVSRSEVRNGMALVYSPHTTCAVVINERESGFLTDFNQLMESLVPVAGAYRHDDLEARTENLDDDPHEIP